MPTLLAARLAGRGGERHIGRATAVAFVQTATLLHDDVVDEADLGRGRSIANARRGNKAPVLVGDALDYSARGAELGQTIGESLRAGEARLPVLLAHAAGDTFSRSLGRRDSGSG